MLQPIDNDNLEQDDSILETRDSTLTTRNKLSENELKPVLTAEILGEKSFSERWKTNRFWLVRATYYVFYSVWMVVMGIGTLIAWLIAMLFI